MTVVHKVSASAEQSATDEYVLSDETVDRYGDVVKLAGWRLANFKKNPIVLFNHDNDFPIGRWENIGVRDGALKARYVPAARGTSARIDEINSLREQGILKATSVGFKPYKSEPRGGGRGVDFTDQELLECSIVSVPANPNALQVAKAMGVSSETIALVFGKDADECVRRSAGKHAPLPPQIVNGRTGPMRLSDKILAARGLLTSQQEELQALVDAMPDTPSDADLAAQSELNKSITATKRSIEGMEETERSLGAGSTALTVTEQRSAAVTVPARAPFAAPSKKIEPIDYVFKGLAVMVKNHGQKGEHLTDTLRAHYGEDAVIKGVLDVITRSATAPATTTTSGWADALVQTAIGEFFDALQPLSIYPKLSELGGRFTFGRNGKVSLPSRAATPTIAGSFVGEGAPIPVRQGAFNSTVLTPKKMAVITTMTREIMEHSTPAIEGLLRQAILEDTAVSIDTVLLDNTAASSIRPAGLRNGVSALTATTGGGFAALVGDLKQLISALITGSNGVVRQPVFLMNPINALSIGLTQNAGGDFPFKADIARGELNGYPVIQSTTVPSGTVFIVDAADFFSATGDDPRFDLSDQATLHMEDTSPTAIGTVGTPNVVAAPVRSLFQTDSLAIRMIMDMNWAMRRTGMVAYVPTVTW